MPKIDRPALPIRRLAVAADLAGDADGVATKSELAALRGEVARPVPGVAGDGLHPAGERAADLERAIGGRARELATLAPALRALPAPLRELALVVDGQWGDADGKVSVAEVDRVASMVLAALPFFSVEAERVLELARHLGLEDSPEPAPSVLQLRLAVAEVDKGEVARGVQFRQLFDEAVREGDVTGVPELLRDAAQHNPRWHRLSILEHTAVAVDAAAELARAAEVDWRDAGATLLLHDVGKILERNLVETPEHSARYGFWGHEESGAEWLAARGLDEEIVFQVRHHSALRGLSAEGTVALYGDGERLRRALVVYVADQVAKGDTPDQLASFAHEEPKLRELAAVCGVDMDALLAGRARLLERWFS